MNNEQWLQNQEYWINRINDISIKFNNDLDKEKALAKMYNKALTDLNEELFNLWIKVNKPNPMLSDLHNYNRLSKLEKNMEDILKNLGKKENNYTKEKMIEAYQEGYKALGIDFALPNKEVIEKMVKQPWIGQNFSNRIWKDKHNLNYELNDILQRGVIQGKPVTQISKELSKRLDVSFNNSQRLVRTETMHYLNEGAKDRYKKAGIEKVKWCTAPDERTCPKCSGLNERIFDINDTPIIPAHPRCRCTYIPIIE
ncbi:minor capsid protein [Clostridium perfringens]|nr:minor capsid protein [Clostridium perfringens]